MVCNVAMFSYCSWPLLLWFLVEATVLNHGVTQRTLRDGCGHWEIWNYMRCVLEWKDPSLYLCHILDRNLTWVYGNRQTEGPLITLNFYYLQEVDYVSCMLARKSNKCPVKHFEVRTILDSGLLWEVRILRARSKCSTLFINYLSE